jgi:energy-coupling factor transporter ATP-binding protein EcfA2
MPLVRLIAEGVGPFRTLDLDLSDGNGKPHLGPHILAGVNGSGKSTVLRTIAWVLDRGELGFQYDDWMEMLKGHPESRALLVVAPNDAPPYVLACSKSGRARLAGWVKSALAKYSFDPATLATESDSRSKDLVENLGWAGAEAYLALAEVRETLSPSPTEPNGAKSTWLRFPKKEHWQEPEGLYNCAAYSPSRALRHLASPDLGKTLPDSSKNCLAFESTPQNEEIQSWLLSLYSKRAIARERKASGEEYTRSLARFEAALQAIYDERVTFEVEIEPRLQPRLKLAGQSLNFSQLPDGVRSTVAWVADFMMREDLMQWDPSLRGRRPGILLLDEVDAHLHPYWQRRLLPAMREALPDVQIIATSHSPFVISSCPNSRVHVLEIKADGTAHARRPVDSPIGESVTTTLKEIFGVDSRFDILTERQLDEWNGLKRREAAHALSDAERERLKGLTNTLASRSEELRSIVASPQTVPKDVLESLLRVGNAAPPARTRKRKSA